MFKSILADIRSTFTYGNMLNRIIIINVVIFVALNILRLFLKYSNGGITPPFYDDFIHFFSVSTDWKEFLLHPWALITSMFLHGGIWHILFNMLILYWFGRIVGDLLGDRRILPVFIMGGIVGALLSFVFLNVFSFVNPGTTYLIGASAGVMAIVFSAAVTSPDYVMRLILLGDIRIKYIALFLLIIDLITIANMSNTGGHVAHIGGAAFGATFVIMLRNGNDLSLPFNRIYDRIHNFIQSFTIPQKSSMKVVHKKSKKKPKEKAVNQDHQERLDKILDKINEFGYENLTDEEKEFLYQASKKD